jgi:hypothetical protein
VNKGQDEDDEDFFRVKGIERKSNMHDLRAMSGVEKFLNESEKLVE